MYPSVDEDGEINHTNIHRANGYIEGYKRGVQENEKEAMMWRQLMEKLNKWSEENEDGPHDKIIGDAWWEIVNENR